MTRHLLQNKYRAIPVVALLLLSALACGCKKNEQSTPVVATPTPAQPKQQTLNVIQKAMSSTVVKLSAAQTGNQFDFSGKKDPFKPDISVKAASAPMQDDLKKTLNNGLPIHSFDVSQFKLIGIITGAKENQAMVLDPSGKGYVLKIGMTIGKNEGRVTAITMSGVEVVEQFKDDSGRVRKENIKITLPRKQ
jgi:type IV pilus assembly protein PilP